MLMANYKMVNIGWADLGKKAHICFLNNVGYIPTELKEHQYLLGTEEEIESGEVFYAGSIYIKPKMTFFLNKIAKILGIENI